MGYALLIVFIGQVIVISIIVIVLRRILDYQLRESAVRLIETMYSNQVDPDLSELTVITYSSLPKADYKRIITSLKNKTGKDVKLHVIQDKSIKGGIIIQMKNNPIDNSLADRLKESGLIG